MCSLMFNAGMWRHNGSVERLKINTRKRVTLTDNDKTVVNYRGKCVFRLAEKNCCNKQEKNDIFKRRYRYSRYVSVKTIKRYNITRDTLIYVKIKLWALTISELGTWGHPQGRRLQAHKKEQFSLHKEKAEKKLNSLEFTKRKKKMYVGSRKRCYWGNGGTEGANL